MFSKVSPTFYICKFTCGLKFLRALIHAQSLPTREEILGPDHLLKITSIAVAFGDVLDKNGKLDEAYNVYWNAFEALPWWPPDGTEDSKNSTLFKRRIQIALKLGGICRRMQWVEDEERWFFCALEEALKAMRADITLDDIVARFWKTGNIHGKGLIAFDELKLPQWLHMAEFIAICMALAGSYNRQRNFG